TTCCAKAAGAVATATPVPVPTRSITTASRRFLRSLMPVSFLCQKDKSAPQGTVRVRAGSCGTGVPRQIVSQLPGSGQEELPADLLAGLPEDLPSELPARTPRIQQWHGYVTMGIRPDGRPDRGVW